MFVLEGYESSNKNVKRSIYQLKDGQWKEKRCWISAIKY